MSDQLSLIMTVVLGPLAFVFLLLSYYFYQRDRKIKNKSSEKTIGKVVTYSWQTTRPPVVEYLVGGETYRKALYYSYTSYLSTPFSSAKVSIKDDILDTKLRMRNNTKLSLNTLMHDHFPIGSEMTVYYNPDNPKLAYVERYAENYMWLIFLGVAMLFLLIIIIFWLVF